MPSNISFPCQWEKGIIERIINGERHASNNPSISEVYGVPVVGIIPDGRAKNTTHRIQLDEAINFREIIHNNGLSFNYLLNGSANLKPKQNKEFRKYIKWVIEDFRADSVTISSLELMKYIRELYPDIPIKLSTIAGVKTLEEINFFSDINPSKIVLHHDGNRNFDNLERILEKIGPLGIDIELMTTESCIRGCQNREEHYSALSQGKSDVKFHSGCNIRKIKYPSEFLKANIIRPEDISFYERMGVKYFKITGRSKPSEWMIKVTQAYLNREYDGNLVDLMGIDPSLKAESFIYINNKVLDGFIENFPKDPEKEDKYCNKWIIHLWGKGNFIVEGAKYKIKDNKLVCTSLPKRLSEVYGDEK